MRLQSSGNGDFGFIGLKLIVNSLAEMRTEPFQISAFFGVFYSYLVHFFKINIPIWCIFLIFIYLFGAYILTCDKYMARILIRKDDNMLRRKAYDFLLDWKKNKDKECLLIKGARQVGKTYLVHEFGKNEYESYLEINFSERPDTKTIFDGSLNAKDIYSKMTAFFPNKLIPKKTLIFLDEIQKCSNARTALKFLAIDNQYDVIASGSLLGLHYGMDADKEVKEVSSIPVGYETQYVMYSLDFEEFLWAYGYNDTDIDMLRNYYERREKVPDAINDKFNSLFNEYIVVGGMPEVVSAYIETKDFNVVQKKQEKILATYDDDITNHAKTVEIPKIRRCYNSLPSQIARENKKFSFAQVEKNTGTKKYGNAVIWISDASFVNVCYRVSEPFIPLSGNEIIADYKLYINDTGLLLAMYGKDAKLNVLLNKMKGNAKGGIYENVIAELLLKNGHSLHYYRTDDNGHEVEFLIEKNGEVIPIEVKASNNSTISLNDYINKFSPNTSYKLINGNVGFVDRKITLPHYMIIFI